jgi:hypothetical protein
VRILWGVVADVLENTASALTADALSAKTGMFEFFMTDNICDNSSLKRHKLKILRAPEEEHEKFLSSSLNRLFYLVCRQQNRQATTT